MLQLIYYPDPVLQKRAEPIDHIDEDTKKLTSEMFEVMYENKGIGLAAPQVGILKRVVTVDISGSEKRNSPLVLINPEIIKQEGEEESEEGCLSLPGFKCKIKRSSLIHVKYTDLEGQEKTLDARDMLAICLQHEIDHLNGKLIIDYAGRLRRSMYEKKLKKMKKKRR